MALDLQAKAFLDYLKALGAQPIHTLSPEKNRKGIRYIAQKTNLPLQDVAKIEERLISVHDGEIKLRIYTPEGKGPFPILVFFHGGGWVVGDLDVVDPPLRALTNSAKVIVVSVDYRLAPEYKFPTPVNDCYLATKWVAENASLLGGDAGRVGVGGESAGGNLAAVVSLMAREKGWPSLSFQVLLYPVTDLSREYPSHSKFDGYFLTQEDMRYFEKHYLRTEEDRRNIYVSPMLAEDLSNLPPALVVTARFDPLHDEGEAYAKRLKIAGVQVFYFCYEDMIHGFFCFGGIIDKGKDLLALLSRNLIVMLSGNR